MLALLPYFNLHIHRDTKTNTVGSLFLFFLFFVVEIEIIYIKIIIIPPKNARVKIKGIQGFEVSIHLAIIVIEEIVRIVMIMLIGDMFIIKNIEVRIRNLVKRIQNLVYLKF